MSRLFDLGIYFANPGNAVYLLAIPALVALMVLSARVRERARRFLGIDKHEKSFRRPLNRTTKHVLYLVGIFFLVITSMGPQWGQKQHTVKAQGLDVCFAIDLSRSMLAEDLTPSRLQSIKNQMTIFLPRLGGDRAALVGFAGSAFVAAPLTPDYAAAIGFLEPLDPSYISNQSTDLSTGVAACLTALGLDKIKDRNEILDLAAKLVVIVSDGENQFDDTEGSIDRAEKLGVPIFAMAVGTAAGAPIPLRDPQGVLRGYLKDPQTNQPIVTKLKEEALAEIADKTGGKLFYARAGIDAWTSFGRAIETYKRDSRDAGTRLDREDRFQIPLFIALLLLLIEFVLPETSIRGRRLAILVFFLATGARAQTTGGGDPRVIKGNKDAYKHFQARDFPRAQEKLTEALIIDSSDPYTRFNWATNKLLSSVNEQGKVSPAIAGEAVKELENLLNDVNRLPANRRPKIEKELRYQLGQAYEMTQNIEGALESYYQSLLAGTPAADLDKKTKTNISRLLTLSQQGGGGGGGDKSEGDGGDEKGDKDGKGGDDKKPKEYSDGKDKQGKPIQKPKFEGTDVSEQEARQILESVKNEEQEVQKRKSQSEARERANRQFGAKGNPEEKGGPQW